MDRRLPRQDFARNLSAKRRLCNTVGERIGRIVEGCAAYCCAVPAARSRAATTTNLARSSLALVLRALFGGAKSCALVNLFMIALLVASRRRPNSAPDHGHLMACLTDMRRADTKRPQHEPANLEYVAADLSSTCRTTVVSEPRRRVQPAIPAVRW